MNSWSGSSDSSPRDDDVVSVRWRTTVAELEDMLEASHHTESDLLVNLTEVNRRTRRANKRTRDLVVGGDGLKDIFRQWGRVEMMNEICFSTAPVPKQDPSMASSSTAGRGTVGSPVEISSDSKEQEERFHRIQEIVFRISGPDETKEKCQKLLGRYELSVQRVMDLRYKIRIAKSLLKEAEAKVQVAQNARRRFMDYYRRLGRIEVLVERGLPEADEKAKLDAEHPIPPRLDSGMLY